MKRWLAEPLVQFIVLGAIVFGVHSWWSARQAGVAGTIVIGEADIARLVTIWSGESGRAPSEQDIRDLVNAHIREEALFREAQRVGLADGDTIIRRRLAQKMEFMLGNAAADGAPDADTLRAFYTANIDRYTAPERISFEHVYISRDGESAARLSAADRALKAGADWKALGDPFMLARTYRDADRRSLVRLFGQDFADAAMPLQAGGWRGPVPSAFGQHFVRITARTPQQAAPYEAVAAKVAADYTDRQTRDAREAEVDRIIGRYTIRLDGAGE